MEVIGLNGETKNSLPLGFGMALAQNEAAMRAFSALPKKERDAYLQKAGRVSSKEEMTALVNGISEGKIPGGL